MGSLALIRIRICHIQDRPIESQLFNLSFVLVRQKVLALEAMSGIEALYQ